MGGRARSLHPRRTGEARGSEADGSSPLSTGRRMSRVARRPSLLGKRQHPARSRLDLPPSGLSRLSGDRPLGGVSGHSGYAEIALNLAQKNLSIQRSS